MRTIDFEADVGGVPYDDSPEVIRRNTDLLTFALCNNVTGARFVIPSKTFHFYNGIEGGLSTEASRRFRGRGDQTSDEVAELSALRDSVLVFGGKLQFHRMTTDDPFKVDLGNGRKPKPCIFFRYVRNVTLTSPSRDGNKAGRGVIDGGGPAWWSFPFWGYLTTGEQRPVLFKVMDVKDFTMENIVLKDAPLYSFQGRALDGLTIRHSSVISRRTKRDGHSLIDLSAFNTDGIDVSGKNVHVHDVDIWTQDDCIAVKDNPFVSSNMMFERINASGLGLSIGSISGTTVRNITFRDSYLYKSVKGLYLKFRTRDDKSPGLIEDILFENITIDQPEQYGVWIGPAQQVGNGQRGLCNTDDCSLCWPIVPFATCVPKEYNTFRNITFRNVVIANPKNSAGMIMGAKNNIDGLVFEDVVVTKGALPQVDRFEMFPGLAQSINDPYTTSKVAIIFACVVALAVFLCVSGCFMCKRKKLRSKCTSSCENASIKLAGAGKDEGTNNSHRCCRRVSCCHRLHAYFLTKSCESEETSTATMAAIKVFKQGPYYLFLLLVLLAYILLWWALFNFLLFSTWSEPYTCEGVTGATALGSTSPIPSCFVKDAPKPKHKFENNIGAIVLAVLVSLMHCLIVVVYWRRRVLQARNKPSCDSRPRCVTGDTELSVSNHSCDMDIANTNIPNEIELAQLPEHGAEENRLV